MNDTIKDKKFVELSYKITDQTTGEILVAIEYPLGYVHGANDILAPAVIENLKGRTKGDIVEVRGAHGQHMESVFRMKQREAHS